MRSKLDNLLAACEAARASLQAELDECVAELDYGRAHLFFKSIRRLNQQLQTLYNLRDKNHDEKEWRGRWLQALKQDLAQAEDYLRPYYLGRIAEAQEKLAELTRASPPAPPGQVVRAALRKLVAGELAGFTWVIQASRQLACSLRLVRRTLILTVPEIQRHRADHTLRKHHLRQFKRLGFRLYDGKDKLLLFAACSSEADVEAVQLILARIAFEVFYFKELAGETFLHYHA